MLEDLNAATDVSDTGQPIPILIKLEPGRVSLEDSELGLEQITQTIELAVQRGMRATLESGNLLTGARFVELDYFEEEALQSVGDFIGYPTIPTTSSGFAHIQIQITKLLAKLNRLPIEDTVSAANGTLGELEKTLGAARMLIESDGVQQLPVSLQETLVQLDDVLEGFSANSQFYSELLRTLQELKSTLQSIEIVSDQLGEKPNAIVFPTKRSPDPEPRINP
jgi:paraquat-inducible protein B